MQDNLQSEGLFPLLTTVYDTFKVFTAFPRVFFSDDDGNP